MGRRPLIRAAVVLATAMVTASATAQERQGVQQPASYAELEKTMKELLAVTVVSPRTEVVVESSRHGTVTRLTGSLKLAPTFSGRVWGMTAIVVF